MDFTYGHRCIFLEVSVNGKDGLLFLLDTGASASAIGTATAEKLGLPIGETGRVEGTAGVIDVRTVRVGTLSVGGMSVNDLTVPAYDLGSCCVPEGKGLDGIIGYDFLRFFSLEIDFSAYRITFSTKTAKGDNPLAFRIDNGIPRFTGCLDDNVSADFRLDTGASLFETPEIYINITTGMWKKLTALDENLLPETYFAGSGAGGLKIRLPVARINCFSIGEITIPGPYVIVQPETGYFARPDAAGFFSNNLLEKYSPVTIDYIGERLYLSGRNE